jgi:hypothetical protein
VVKNGAHGAPNGAMPQSEEQNLTAADPMATRQQHPESTSILDG